MSPPLPFVFPDMAIVRRIEAAEADLAASCARLAMAAAQPAIVLPLAGGLSVFARAGSPVNKAVGVGVGRGLDLAELDAAERALAERGEALRIELSTMSEPGVARALTERGYRLEAFENVLALPLAAWSDDASTSDALAITVVEEMHPWRDVLIDGFARPDDSPIAGEPIPRDALEGAMADFLRVEGLRRYLAQLDGQNAGAASMRIHGGVALLCGASTLPAARRRGVQGAVLARRLRDAKAQGANVAVVTTMPGSQSHANALRRGFSLLYVRAILMGPAPAAA